MADFTALKTAIQTYIKQNGNEEITGEILQEILLSVVTTLGDSAINDLITALADEVAARQNADGTLQQNITNEATARGNADTALGGRIDDEATARANGDTALSDRLGSTITAENTAADQIGAEAEARAAADTALQGLIDGITDNIENGYIYAGIATPSSTPATGKVFYIALTAGTYTNFGNTEVSQGINILKYNGSAWSLDAFIGIDDEPTPNSPKLVKSGGAFESIMTDGSAFDISAHFASGGTLATYADLDAALTALNTLSTSCKRGGMSIKFVCTSDNKYVQARLMSNSFTTNVAYWQAVDAEPIANSKNLVESGGIYDMIKAEVNVHLERESIGNVQDNSMIFQAGTPYRIYYIGGTSDINVFAGNDASNYVRVTSDGVDFTPTITGTLTGYMFNSGYVDLKIFFKDSIAEQIFIYNKIKNTYITDENLCKGDLKQGEKSYLAMSGNEMINGFVNWNNGQLVTPYQKHSPELQVNSGEVVIFHSVPPTSSSFVAIIAGYDSNGNYVQSASIQGNTPDTQTDPIDITYTVPNGISKIICSCRDNSYNIENSTIYIKREGFILKDNAVEEENLSEELKTILEERKENPFKVTFNDKEYLYICVGYGTQATGGYSIAVDNLYLTDEAIKVSTSLLGPGPEDETGSSASYPYIVLKTEYLDIPVVFE